MTHGFTNDVEQYEQVVTFRDAAVADGWSIEPTYEQESINRASKLHKSGFTMQVLTRTKSGKWNYEAQVNIWGPDGLAIKLNGPVYDWNAIKAGLRTCNNCGTTDVDTKRYSFAGRACANCIPEMRKQSEYPGWDN